MLNRDALIVELIEVEGKGKSHDELFNIRKDLRALGLVALGERYRKAFPDQDPYNLKAA
jgi:hypothetical protein